MEYNEKIKYIDFVFKNIQNPEFFSIQNILFNEKTSDEDELDIISFGEKHDLFEKTGVWFKLTLKGEKMYNSKKGFEKFEKKIDSKNSPKWYNQNWIGYSLAAVFGIINLIQTYYNNDLKNQFSSASKSLDSLKVENYHLKENNSLYESELLNYKDSLFVLKSKNLKETELKK